MANETNEYRRLDLILEGNAFSALSFLQGAIRHCLWRCGAADISRYDAALRIERAQDELLRGVINDSFSRGYHAALASQATEPTGKAGM